MYYKSQIPYFTFYYPFYDSLQLYLALVDSWPVFVFVSLYFEALNILD